ncbi:hypothetical protein FOZ62_027544, partial [Perkinsus olseni]
MLPPGHITTGAFSIDSQGRCFIAASPDVDDLLFLWRVPSALDFYGVLTEGDKLIDIQVSPDGSAVFAEIGNSLIPASRGVAYDDPTGLLIATASKNDAVYQYSQ